jgi:hypothetical protein
MPYALYISCIVVTNALSCSWSIMMLAGEELTGSVAVGGADGSGSVRAGKRPMPAGQRAGRQQADEEDGAPPTYYIHDSQHSNEARRHVK